MLDNFTVVFRASGDALFYVVGDSDEVRERGREAGLDGMWRAGGLYVGLSFFWNTD